MGKKILLKVFKISWLIFVTMALMVTTFGSATYLFEKRNKIKNRVNVYFGQENYSGENIKGNENDYYWAKEIMKGGYILHFRHAEREKWIDIEAYDALESDVLQIKERGTRTAENSYFNKAVCLNSRGKVQAAMMKEHFDNIGFPVSHVISSTSCRGRETANIAFGGYESAHRLLVHNGPYWQNTNKRIEELKQFYLELPISEGGNTIVTAHNSVIMSEMFDETPSEELTLEEGGFYVISKKDGKLKLEYRFWDFSAFNRVFYKR